MNRWMKLTVIIAFSFVLLCGCDDDDFAPYTNIDYDVSIHLNSNIFVIAEARQELSQIADEYAKDMPLTYADYEFYSTHGTAEFQFLKPYPNGENRVTLVTMYVDLNTYSVTKINYKDGHGKSVCGFGSEIKQTENINIMDVYNDNIPKEPLESNQYLNIMVTDAEIVPNILSR